MASGMVIWFGEAVEEQGRHLVEDILHALAREGGALNVHDGAQLLRQPLALLRRHWLLRLLLWLGEVR